MKIILYLVLIISFSFKSLFALDTLATHAIVYDHKTKDILFEKNSNIRTSPASMTKIMTAYIIFDLIKNGNLKLDEKFIVSEKAYKKGGSRMFVELNSKVTIKDLLYGVIVQSGNDASIVLAENISVTESGFADLMNEYAKKIGMKNTNFVNSSGWPHPNHYSTMYDLAVLSSAIINDFPSLYKIFAKEEFTYNKIKQPNRNSLLKHYEGVDGLKTGYVKDSGYGNVISSLKDDRRIILVVNGLESSKSRVSESEKLLNWAYRHTKHTILFSKGQIITSSDMWLGKENKVDLISGEELLTTLSSNQEKNIKAKLVYEKPIIAPVKANQQVGKIVVNIADKETIEIPLLAKNSIKRVNPIIRIFSALNYLIFGNI